VTHSQGLAEATIVSQKFGATENAGVENAGADRGGGKCRSRLAVWKAEPILYSDTAIIKLLH